MELRTQAVVLAILVGAACAASRPKDGGAPQAIAQRSRPADAGPPRPRVDAGPRPPRVDAGPPPRPTDGGAPVDGGAPADGGPAPDGGTPKPHSGTLRAVAPDSSSCPKGMILVDGDYCTEVEHSCKKSWFDKSNKKTICEEFEPWSKCVGDKQKKRFCIDRYTYPNEKGARPEVMNRFHQAELKCAALGKRLCTETEWTMACEGPRYLPYPYGYVRDPNKCRGDQPWDSPDMKKVAKRDPAELERLWQGVPNGSQPECVSEYGVPDLPGNVDEVVASESFGLPGYKGKFDSVHTGGPWYKGVRNQCRPKIYTHDEAFYYYFLGFRCCSEPDGKPTDPRTPYQIKKNWKLERVERSAGITLIDLKKRLEDKAQGRCTCAPRDILCNTICGTLLRPGGEETK